MKGEGVRGIWWVKITVVAWMVAGRVWSVKICVGDGECDVSLGRARCDMMSQDNTWDEV